MKARSWTGCLLTAALLGALWGCDPYAYIPARKQTGPPPQAGVETTPAPAPAGGQPSPPAATEAGGDLLQQVQALEARVQRLENRLAQLNQQPGPVAPGYPAPKPAAGPASPPKPGPAVGPDKTFQEGLRLYQAKKYGAAREKFFQSLKSQPQGGKAFESRYYLADSFYQEKKYREASVEFNKLVTQHPKSTLAPAGMLRLALCYHHLQQKKNYQSTLKKLIQKYPQSAEAKEAQKWLKSEGR